MAMIYDPWAIPAAFHSVIVKRDAVTCRYPGGIEAFEQAFRPSRKNGALFLLLFLSKQEVDLALGQLEAAGLGVPEDAIAADANRGPLMDCPGLTFRSEGEGSETRWWVNVTPRTPWTKGPRRVIGSLVHYVYEDDEDEEFLGPPCRLVVESSVSELRGA